MVSSLILVLGLGSLTSNLFCATHGAGPKKEVHKLLARTTTRKLRTVFHLQTVCKNIGAKDQSIKNQQEPALAEPPDKPNEVGLAVRGFPRRATTCNGRLVTQPSVRRSYGWDEHPTKDEVDSEEDLTFFSIVNDVPGTDELHRDKNSDFV
ncbi:hypothetical protein CHS0354_042082 [Potamilus streckersoni]|uniref:Uncharacterized protein n=1 Tax=Potamilus streckersoni TaxID=2493646 RepID=A0AAE0TLQ7_9BIVA|nr:hypothetical protein CHS0354_042082 [Potamilus streckersoni]